MLCAPYCCHWNVFAFSPVSSNDPLCLLWAGFCPCTLKGPVWGHCGLTVVSDQMPALGSCAKALVTLNCFPCVVPWEPFVGWWGLQSDHVSFPGPSVRVAVTLNYRALSLYCPLWDFCWRVGLAVIWDVCSQPIAGAAVERVCVVIFPFHWGFGSQPCPHTHLPPTPLYD